MPRRKLSLDPRYETPADTRVLRMAEFGTLIRLRRKELGMTQRELARLTGFSMRLVGELEDEYGVTASTLARRLADDARTRLALVARAAS